MSKYGKCCALMGMCLILTATVTAAQEPVHEGKPLSFWVEQLKLGRSGGNFTAFEKMGVAAAPALPALTELLKNPNFEVRIVTSLAIGGVAKALVRADRLGTLLDKSQLAALKPAARALIPLLGDADPADDQEIVASRSQWALTEMGPISVPELLVAAKDKTKPPMVRARAIQCLARIGPAAIDSLPTLRGLLNDKTEDALVRGESNAAIKKIERTEQ